MDWIIGIIIIGGVVVIGVEVALAGKVSDRKKLMQQKLAGLDDFDVSQKLIGNDGGSGIAIDERRKTVCLIKQRAGDVLLDVCTYRDILAAEIFEDGQTITQTSRASQLGGALIGGIALGGVGAIIGGLSGKQTSSQKPSRIDLRITVNRIGNPLHDINFMNIESPRDGTIYTEAMQRARHWHGLIAVLIRRADEEETRSADSAQAISQTGSRSVSDELRKLAQLKAEGVLSEEEFATQKARLLV